MNISKDIINNVEVLTIQNDHLKCDAVPALGGKIMSVYNKDLQKEFLWKNQNLDLAVKQTGDDYDSNFLGGIDELIPNDIPENIDGIDYPDHGELWTTPLSYEIRENKIILTGSLRLSGLFYQKTIYLNEDSPSIMLYYIIRNDSPAVKKFLWKMHAALQIKKGDRLVTPAQKGKVVDIAYSRFSNTNEFDWPMIEKTDASEVPGKNNEMDFFFLYDIPVAEMKFLGGNKGHEFRYSYDKTVFPFQWYFASYGGFLNHYTAILEPCSAMPLSVNDAKQLNQCTVLQPDEELSTQVRIYAGKVQT
ncbi:MAG: hypothetical protein JWM28_2159 [Chitinophagaceae bacterium]|nr:hypothetical protein [Chitinophagaceae bacterium]